jgi:predicted phage-related endonuclease
VYIDLTYYLQNGGKEGMTDAVFARNEYRARKLVDKLTQGRIKTMAEIPEAVKRLMVELVSFEATQGAELTEHQAVISFSNDGYSETFADPLTVERVKEIECELISEYLSDETDDEGTPLLYLGVN